MSCPRRGASLEERFDLGVRPCRDSRNQTRCDLSPSFFLFYSEPFSTSCEGLAYFHTDDGRESDLTDVQMRALAAGRSQLIFGASLM